MLTPSLGYAKAVEQAVVVAPVTTYAHRQIEVDLAAELSLDLAARSGADRLDHLTVRADENPLL